jgi:hypothetical protein
MSLESDTERRFAYKAHKARLAQYEAILAGNLTPAQRDFVKRRVEEEHTALRHLVANAPENTCIRSSLMAPPSFSAESDPAPEPSQ